MVGSDSSSSSLLILMYSPFPFMVGLSNTYGSEEDHGCWELHYSGLLYIFYVVDFWSNIFLLPSQRSKSDRISILVSNVSIYHTHW